MVGIGRDSGTVVRTTSEQIKIRTDITDDGDGQKFLTPALGLDSSGEHFFLWSHLNGSRPNWGASRARYNDSDTCWNGYFFSGHWALNRLGPSDETMNAICESIL